MKFININSEELLQLGQQRHADYVHADPFPSGYFDNFFNEEMLNMVLDEFPDLSKKPVLQYNDPNQVKLASDKEDNFGDVTKQFMHFMNSAPFLNFLSALTGIKNLIPDPYYLGGGHHQIMPGGFLKLHADFNKHPDNKLDRRLNVLVYLNKDWEDSYGGHFQLWDKDMKECRAKILPLFNRMAMFSTTSHSYHGHPDPLTCPADRSRRSLALYYYSNGRPEEEINEAPGEHTTLFKYRKGEDDTTRRKNSLRKAVELFVPPIFLHAINKLK